MAEPFVSGAEPSGAVESRHVGREDVLDLLDAGLGRLRRGERPMPLYLFGPEGVGKSHLVALGAARARRVLGEGVRVRVVSEDRPALRDADELWDLLARGEGPPGWVAWEGAARRGRVRPAVVFVEGFDRRLDELAPESRKRLRGLMQANPEVWVVATGTALTDPFVRNDEAFFGWFDARALDALTEAEAGALADAVAEAAAADPRWPARRDALRVLAGGNPRAIVALAGALADRPDDGLPAGLARVLDAFTPYYQLRFRDLAPTEQRLVDLLARAPRELGPTDVAGILGGSPSTWSSVAWRLVDRGVLAARHEGRASWYALTETLFRHWVESRSAPPGASRATLVAGALERPEALDEALSAQLLEGDRGPLHPELARLRAARSP